MSRRTKVLIGIILAVVILALLFWLWLRPRYFGPGTEGPAANVNAVPSPLALSPVNVAPTAQMPEVSDEEKIRSDLGRLAAAFAERFGSYSNQGDFENLLDLKPMMTARLQSEVDDLIEESKAAGGDNSVYFGVTTKAVSTNIVEIDEEDGAAKIVIGAQRREASGTMADNVRIYYQDLELKFLKIGDEWRVEEAEWK